MMIGERRDLRKVGHHDHLRGRRQARESPTHFDRNRAAHSRVDLVEDHRGCRGVVGQSYFERERQARQFAT